MKIRSLTRKWYRNGPEKQKTPDVNIEMKSVKSLDFKTFSDYQLDTLMRFIDRSKRDMNEYLKDMKATVKQIKKSRA
jgi:hypothetical protein